MLLPSRDAREIHRHGDSCLVDIDPLVKVRTAGPRNAVLGDSAVRRSWSDAILSR